MTPNMRRLEAPSPGMMSMGMAVIIDDACLRLVDCGGFILIHPDGRAERTKPAGVYLERLDEHNQWHQIGGPFWGGPIGGWPEKAVEALKNACNQASQPEA